MTPSILVKFQFDGETKYEIAKLTYEQYSNLKSLPIITSCKIVKNAKPTLSKTDVETLNKRLSEAFQKSKSHTKSLSE